MSAPEVCTRCVLDSSFPGLTIRDGICSLCANGEGVAAVNARKSVLADGMKRVIRENAGQAEYDCVVAFSGGKDSSYTLMMLVRDLGLRCLAITIDNGFISPQAVENCRTVTGALGVDFLTFTPAFSFMKKMYVASMEEDGPHVRAASRRASGMCNSCIGLINAYMMKTAIRQGIPMIAGGYVGGQVPQDAAVLRVNVDRQRRQQEVMLARKTAAFGADAERYFDLGSAAPAGPAELILLNPMTTVALSEDEIMAAVGELGWKRTADTGAHSSNCRLNDLGIAMHFRQHGFHPYALEVSEQVRGGLISREDGLRKIRDIPQMEEVSAQLRKLDLSPEAL